MLISHHPLPVGHVSLLVVQRPQSHGPGAALHLLMVEGVWTMQENWAGLIDVLLLRLLLLLLLMVVGGQLLSVMMLVLMHGLMGRHGVVVLRLGAQGAVHYALKYSCKRQKYDEHFEFMTHK